MPHHLHFHHYWSGKGQGHKTTDNLHSELSPSKPTPAPPDLPPRASTPPATISEPTIGPRRTPSRWSLPPSYKMSTDHSPSGDITTSVTLSFTNPGTQPPVYVATSLSSPPWEVLEMAVEEQRMHNGDLIFTRTFHDVKDGDYQYKFRLGPGDWWVLDEKAETATDNAGNRNNVVTVKSKPDGESTDKREHKKSELANSTVAFLQTLKQESEPTAAPQQGETPLPIMVVDKVPDQNRPVYGDVDAESLHENEGKRQADAEPDVEYVATELEVQDPKQQPQIPVPTLIVEKTDTRPEHGDDMGPNSTEGQKLAHKMRTADAEPDEIVISPEIEPAKSDTAPDDESAAAASMDLDDGIESPMLERVPTFAYEEDSKPNRFFAHEDSSDEPAKSSPDLDDELAAAAGIGPDEDDESPRLEHTPTFAYEEEGKSSRFFAHEASEDEVDDLKPTHGQVESTDPPRSPNKQDPFEEPDPNDSTIEPFPTDREAILAQLQRTETLFAPTDVEDNALHHSPSSRSSSVVEVSAPSLNVITEDEDEESVEDSMAAEGTREIHEAPESSAEEVRSTRVSTGTMDEEGSVQEDGATEGNAEIKDNSRHELAHSTDGATRDVTESVANLVDDAPPTPPLTPKENLIDTKNDSFAEGSVEEVDSSSLGDAVRNARATTSTPKPESSTTFETDMTARSETPASMTKPAQTEGLFAAFWRVVFGSWLDPLGRWISRVCGGKRKATGLLTTIAVTALAFYLYSEPQLLEGVPYIEQLNQPRG
ncbi:hypothetical protein M501DRAFT_986943 [Patellaria atrata CBS 101060]|uniref:AMP-activated protein kinase glycogen-binding domain-containing protein n=1 Tax=Patellaria atrata CBS 101060 TaxID=1346257 RepID=A0A9P4S5T0_9PEZI|nr:hypothetical protein M501DRAFT_986943 [Patellaria atrata CBS 101060]